MPSKSKDRQIEVWVTSPGLVEDEDRMISRAQRRELLSRILSRRSSYDDEDDDEDNDEDTEALRRLIVRRSREPVASQQTQPVKLRASRLQDKVREMAGFLAGLEDGAHLPGVRPDSVSFSFTVASDGAVKWIMGAKVEGSASITFKFDAVSPSSSAT